MRFRPSREEFHAHAADHNVVPVWTELLADLETPVAAYTKLVGDGPGFLLESVEGAERWARFSFVGRNPSATLILRGDRVELDGPLPDGIPTDRGILAAMEALLAQYTSPTFADLPPLHGGMMGYLGYDVIREVEHLPDMPPDDRDYPDAVMSVIGSLAAFDHWRQRVVPHRERPHTRHGSRRARRGVRRRGRPGRAGGARPRPAARVHARRAADPGRRPADPRLDDGQRHVSARRRSGEGARRRRRHLPGGAGPALRPRTRGGSVRRVPRPASGQPVAVHVLREASGADDRRLVAGADGSAARSQGDLAPDRRDPPTRPHRRGRSADGGRTDRTPEGARRARDARRPRPQRRRASREVRHGDRRRVDDARAIQPRDAPHVAGVG